MGPAGIAFSSYAIIGLTLLILAASVALYLLRLPPKSRATWALIAFFFAVALSGASTILTNALVQWGDLFAPWQDVWILAGGVALTHFAYCLPHYCRTRESLLALLLAGSLAAGALFYTLLFNARLILDVTPEAAVADAYYVLLPLGTLLVLLILLRRSLRLAARAAPAGQDAGMWRRLLTTRDEDAKALRNLALALSLAFLPGLQTLLAFPQPYGFILSNIGSILAITAIALVYFNYAPEVESFMAKLVGVTLATVLLILAVSGSVDAYLATELVQGVAVSGQETAAYISALVWRWLLLILVASGFVLVVFPLFFRRALVQPMANLLAGIGRVNDGDLDTVVPLQFHDELGSLTDSFNKLTRSLRISREQQEQLFNRLQASYAELEERVTDRTRELSAFTDLTMLPGEREELVDILQPALSRVIEVGLSDAIGVHVLAEDRRSIELVAQQNLPPEKAKSLQLVPASASFAARLLQIDDPAVVSGPDIPPQLPQAFLVPQFRNYLGSPLAAGGHSHGWLSCYRVAGHAYTVSEIAFLAALARQMGILIENQRLRQRIKEVATHHERRRLARDLHDSVTQLVYSMTLFTRSSQEALLDGDRQRLETSLRHMADTSFQALREMRFLLFELQPPVLKDEGLAGALAARLDMVERRLGVQVVYSVEDDLPPDSTEIERELYFVAIEALNNTLKHARADRVELSVRRENGFLRLCVTDNGCGFDPSHIPAGLGIDNMRRRMEDLSGQLSIDSVPNGGTRVMATVPLSPRMGASPRKAGGIV